MHSFPVTEHHVVVPEMLLRYCAQNLPRAEPTPMHKFEWQPGPKGFTHLMCKASGKIVSPFIITLLFTSKQSIYHYCKSILIISNDSSSQNNSVESTIYFLPVSIIINKNVYRSSLQLSLTP